MVVKSKGLKITLSEYVSQISSPLHESLSQTPQYEAISDSLMLARGVLSISILEGDYFAFVYFQKKGLVENPWDLSSAMVVATRS